LNDRQKPLCLVYVKAYTPALNHGLRKKS